MTLNCHKLKFSRNFRVISQIWEATTAERMKMDKIVAYLMYFSAMSINVIWLIFFCPCPMCYWYFS